MKKMIMAVLFMTMVISLSVPALAYMTFDDVPDTIYDLESLLEFIEQADDFDKVYIGATIDITEATTVGRDELIRVQLLRDDGFTGAIFNVSIRDDDEVKFQNIEIWGYGIESESAIIIYHEYQDVPVIFDNVRFEGCKGKGNGGGISVVRGNARIINCNFGYCSANSGGGVYVSPDGTAFIENSILANNDVGLGDGGAIANFGSMTLKNTAVFYNNADIGGGIANMGICEIDGCTIRGNTARITGGGIYNNNTLIVNANLVFHNESPVGSGRDISSNGTLVMTRSVDAIGAMLSDGSFERIGWYSDDWDSLDFPDEYYKEYAVPSTAIRQSVQLVFEYEETSDDTPPIVSDIDSLIEAITQAEDGDTIYIDNEIQPRNGDFIGNLDKRITLKRAEGYSGRFFSISYTCTIQNIIFDGAGIEANIQGGTFVVQDDVYFKDCTFSNFSNSSGNIIEIKNGKASIENCTFIDNASLYSGSVISTHANTSAYMNGCTLDDNSSFSWGGAIYNNGLFEISESTFTNNSAYSGGVGFNGETGTMILEDCVLSDNAAISLGGVIINEGILTLNNSLFLNNTAADAGNDVFLFSSAFLTIIDSLYSSEIFTNSGFNSFGWYYDNNDARYGENNAISHSNTVNTFDGNTGLIFVCQTIVGSDGTPEQTANHDGSNSNTTPEPAPENNDNSDGNSNDGYTPPTYKPSIGDSSTTTDNIEADDKAETTESPHYPFQRSGAILDHTTKSYLLGYGDGDLGENDPISRAQMAMLVYRLLTPDSVETFRTLDSGFSDVSSDVWYSEAVATLRRVGIVNGVGDNKYNPDGTITWAEMITFFARFVEVQTGVEFASTEVEKHWSRDYVSTAIALGWLENDPSFEPNQVVLRHEMVSFINHIFSLYCETDA